MQQPWPVEFQMEIRDADLKRYMAEAERRGKDLKPPLKRCGIVMMRSFAMNFQQEGRPSKWKPLSPNTVAGRRKGSSRVLQDTGRLRMSLTARTASGNIYKLTPNSLVMGTNLSIAQYHQYGTKPYTITAKRAKALRIPTPDGIIFRKQVRHPGLPARPFVLIQRQDEREMVNIFADYLEGK